MDELEENGIISAQDGAKPRRVLSSAAGPAPDLFDDESSED